MLEAVLLLLLLVECALGLGIALCVFSWLAPARSGGGSRSGRRFASTSDTSRLTPRLPGDDA